MLDKLDLRRDGEDLEVFDPELGSWVCRLRPVELPDAAVQRSPLARMMLAELTGQLPGLMAALGQAGAVRVVFSPALSEGLKLGTYTLMQTSTGVAPTAVDTAGRIVGHGRVLGEAGSWAAVGAGAALTAGIGLAAAMAQQRWLEQTLSGIAETAARIEERLRDDDWGLLDHAADLATACWRAAADGAVPAQLSAELAAVRPMVGAVVRSRGRFTIRLISRLNDLYENRKNQLEPWTAAVVNELGGGLDEILLHLASLHSMGRVDAATAAVLALEGAAGEALRLVDSSVSAARADYHLLYRYFRPLARFQPTPNLVARLMDMVPVAAVASLGPAEAARRTHEQAKELFTYLDRQVGDAMPQLSSDALELVVPLGLAS